MPWSVTISFEGNCQPPVTFDRDDGPLARHMFVDASGRRIASGGMDSGLPAPKDLVPTAARLKSRARWRPCHFLQLMSFWGVSEEVKQIVERLEPGVHEFFPLEIMRTNKEPVGRPYYLLNICNRVDAIAPEKSRLRYETYVDTFYSNGIGKGIIPKLVFEKPKIAGKCMWRDARYSHALFSDEFMAALTDLGVKELNTWEVFAE